MGLAVASLGGAGVELVHNIGIGQDICDLLFKCEPFYGGLVQSI